MHCNGFFPTSFKWLSILALLFISSALSSQTESGYVDIQKGELFYRIWGEGKPIVFLNGGPGFSSKGYESYAEELSKYRKVILFDQRGTGKSRLKTSAEISISKMVKDLEKLRKHLGIEKWDVMGHSFGGRYAMYYAAKHGEHIDKLILSASPAYNFDSRNHAQEFTYDDYKFIDYFFQFEEFAELEEELLKKNPSKKAKRMARKCTNAIYYTSKKENYLKVANWFLKESEEELNVTIAINQSCRRNPIKSRKLKSFENSVLILHGIADFLNIANPSLNHEIFPNSKFEIIYDSGHIISVDQKEKYYKVIGEFLMN